MRDPIKNVWLLRHPIQRVETLFLSRRFPEALAYAERRLSGGVRDARLLHLAAASAAELKQREKAEYYWRAALTLQPGMAAAAFGLGVLYGDMNRLDDAEKCYRHAVDRNPRYGEAYCNLGNLYCELGRLDEAVDCYRTATALNSAWVNVKNNLSFVLLSQGHFAEGWELRETRYDPRMPNRNSGPPPAPFPQWRGEPLEGKTILVWDEQGFGDAIQFMRYMKFLRQQGVTKITFVCRPQLKPVFETMPEIDECIALGDTVPVVMHDYWVFPLSLALYHKTDLATIPGEVPYLSAPEDRRAQWAKRLPKKGFKVGLVWKGSTGHPKDSARSLDSLEVLRPLWSVPGVSFVSLQKGQGEDQAQNPPEGMPLTHLGSDIQDFGDSAAILDQLDLLISVDTAIVHLAGAMGKPVWMLTPTLSDWRWLLEREDSPWYPTLRLFRQAKRNEWEQVVERMRSELTKMTLKAYVGKSAKR